jgi:exodeoxyribonuclease VIII
MRKNKRVRGLRVPSVSSKGSLNDKLYTDVMVDLETMGTDSTACIISIGAVRFRMGLREDQDTIRDESRSFYARLDTDEQRVKGRTVSPDTMAWWSEQSEEARAVFDEEPEGVRDALDRFSQFCKGAKRVWGNGNMFDNAILRSIYADYDRDYPVAYWSDLDLRTLTYLWNFLTNWGSKGKRPQIEGFIEHNALDDARLEAMQATVMVNELEKKSDGS